MSECVDISIIIVNWKSADYLKHCLKSIRASLKDISYEVLVLDNASYDGSAELIDHHFPWAYFIQLSENIGFGAANNRGAALARGGILLFLNPDTEVLPGSIERMKAILDRVPDTGIVGCRLLNSDGSLQESCVQSFPTFFNQIIDSNFVRKIWPNWRIWGNSAIYKESCCPEPVDAVSGAAMLMKAALFKSLGGFSSEYFMYSEDLDMCYKARRRGLQVFYLNSAEIIHHGGKSSDRSKDRHFASIMQREAMLTFMQCNRGRMYASLFRIAMAANAIVRILLLGTGHLLIHKREKRSNLSHSMQKWRSILGWVIWETGHLKTNR